jgi:serine/threonine protein kinase
VVYGGYGGCFRSLHHLEELKYKKELSPALQDAILNEVKQVLKTLHNGGFVHGDIRTLNVLVRKAGGKEGNLILLVDWDWAGRMGEVKYPINLNPAVSRPKEAAKATVIKASHDDAMADLLL